MEAVAFVKLLHQSLTRSKPGAQRHILRVSRLSDYRAIVKSMKEWTSVYKALAKVRPLPLIQAFSYQGRLPASFLRRFEGAVSVEEDVPITVHALPAEGQPVGTVGAPARRPFIPSSIRSLRVPALWKRTLGNQVKIGVIDTGVDYYHPDLQQVLARGVNLVNPRMLPFDDNGHGTHIAGTIAATGRHAMKGIAPRALLYPVKAFDYTGSAYVSDIIKGIDWCVYNGVHIINMSFGMKKRSDAMLEAVRNATRAGVVIIASSGNDGRRGFIDYPARFPQTISVGAIDRQCRVAPFSNRGRRIDVYAPGESIKSTWPHRMYHVMSGTSMATSHVTGIIALLLALRPNLTPAQIKRIVSSAQLPLKGRTKKARSPGRIDAMYALRQLK